jgi:hypothetical protein
MNAYAAAGNREPTVVLLRANGQVFGGYAADAWDFADLFGGSPRSFLFSLSKDVKIPYHGRVRGPRQANDDFLRQQHDLANMQAQAAYMQALQQAQMATGGAPQFDEYGRLITQQVDEYTGQVINVAIPVPRPKPFVRHDCLKSNADTLQFGLGDLVLKGDFSECASELEYSYGVGLKPGSADTKGLLAGAPVFKADAVEIYAVTPTPASSALAAMQQQQQQGGEEY